MEKYSQVSQKDIEDIVLKFRNGEMLTALARKYSLEQSQVIEIMEWHLGADNMPELNDSWTAANLHQIAADLRDVAHQENARDIINALKEFKSTVMELAVAQGKIFSPSAKKAGNVKAQRIVMGK